MNLKELKSLLKSKLTHQQINLLRLIKDGIKRPSKIKLIFFGFSKTFNSCNKDKDQKKISKTSVDNMKEEKETAGIKKKVKPVIKASFLFCHNLYEIR